MKRSIILAAAAAMAWAGASALGSNHVSGVVTYINTLSGILNLSGGQIIKFDNKVRLYGFAPGDKVTVGFEDTDGVMTGTSISRDLAIRSTNIQSAGAAVGSSTTGGSNGGNTGGGSGNGSGNNGGSANNGGGNTGNGAGNGSGNGAGNGSGN